MFRNSLLLVLSLGCFKQSESAVADAVAASPVVVEPATEEAAVATPADGQWIHYGAEFAADQSVTAKALLDNPQAHMEGVIRVTDATITDVCQTKGCWLVIADQDRNMRIFTKDHGFVVAKDSGGSTCELEGTVVSKVIKQEFVEHLEGESTAVESMPEKGMSEGDTIYEFLASAVRINGEPQVSIPVGEAPAAPEAVETETPASE
jgi:hypothetical protein